VVKTMGVKDEKIIKALKKFKRPDHRLEFIGEKKGIRFYDDSISTIPEATIFALDSLGSDVETLIVGGFDRGIKFEKIAEKIVKSSVRNLILFPTSGEKILREVKKRKGKVKSYAFTDMKEAVKKCFAVTSAGRICLLSPASPSFGIFKDYKERGDLFKKYIKDFK
jgi:UDP-N-acetylmuramoylalanine--D-glutamate ligase